MLAVLLDRLKAELPAVTWRSVEIAEDIDILRELAGQVETPACILMPWHETAEPSPLMTGGHRQRVEVQFATGIVLRHYDPKMGAERAVQFDALRGDVETALAGWEPPGADAPCELIGGAPSPISKGVSIFMQTWATARFLTGA